MGGRGPSRRQEDFSSAAAAEAEKGEPPSRDPAPLAVEVVEKRKWVKGRRLAGGRKERGREVGSRWREEGRTRLSYGDSDGSASELLMETRRDKTIS